MALERPNFGHKVGYFCRWLPNYAWQRLTRPGLRRPVHLIFALADHFEPAIIAGDGRARAPYDVQEQRLERWCREYPRIFDGWQDHDGRPFVHTYFYPAEQYRADRPQDTALMDRLAGHCHAGWGEIEIHLHHGMDAPDTAENTRRELIQFRDALAARGCLSLWNGTGSPRYAFIHGNFALANSARGQFCGVNEEIQVLSETGCYADFTLPANVFNFAQPAKINSMYETVPPLHRKSAHRSGRDLARGRAPQVFPLLIQGPLMLDFDLAARSGFGRIENGALTGANPPSMRRLSLWKKAAISVQGRPDWLFIKLHCHGMNPTQDEAVLGPPMQRFVSELVEGAADRKETLHFVRAREMVNIALAACDGREGNPGEYRDYRLQPVRATHSKPPGREESPMAVEG